MYYFLVLVTFLLSKHAQAQEVRQNSKTPERRSSWKAVRKRTVMMQLLAPSRKALVSNSFLLLLVRHLFLLQQHADLNCKVVIQQLRLY